MGWQGAMSEDRENGSEIENRQKTIRISSKEHTVHKIGGTSMSDMDAVLSNILVGERTGDALYNRIFIVSAYGGVTDRLLENKKTSEPGVFQLYADGDNDWAWGDALSETANHLCEINHRVFDDSADRKLADRFVRERVEGVRSCLIDLHRLCSFGHFKLNRHLMTVREMLAAVGEAHSAHNTMLLLRRRGVDATFVDLSGWREETADLSLDERIARAFSEIDITRELPIVTGYAQSRDGLMGGYGRGYSEVTFSRIACLTGAKEALIHKEYHLSSADPKIVGDDRVRPIGQTDYDVADQLSNMGMEAIHPRAAKGLRQQGIPLRIVNTFEPDHPGTVIAEIGEARDGARAGEGSSEGGVGGVEIVTGLQHAVEVEIFDQDMVGVPGAEEIAVNAFRRYKVPVVSKSLNANTQAIYVAAPLKQVRRCVDTIEKHQPEAHVQTRKVSIVSAIGAGLQRERAVSRALVALDAAGIETLAVHMPARGVDVQFVLPQDRFEEAIRILHRGLVEERGTAADAEREEASTDSREAA